MPSKRAEKDAVIRSDFAALLAEGKGRIQSAQTRAVLAVNSELVRLYWDIGRMIDERQRREGWGAAVIPRLARELHNELPDRKGVLGAFAVPSRSLRLRVLARAMPLLLPLLLFLGGNFDAQ